VLVVTTFDLDEYVYAAMRAGAAGFLLKDAPEAQLIAGLRTAKAGAALLSPQITRRLVETFARPSVRPLDDSVTAREREVLVLVARGLSNAEIARDLDIGETTVKTHVSRVLMKLGLSSRTQAVVLAYESGLIRPGEAVT
jgi:DNA-binding NarL/FixJ family response regulator